jgi:peptidoglycan hydrolase CwlO-like protein
MKKHVIAALIAVLMTACVGTSVFAIGESALLNQNGVPPANSAKQASTAADMSVSQGSELDQLRSLVSQYQDHERQYQAREQQLQDQLAQANAQIKQDQELVQQVQRLLGALEQRGMISITNDGRILINR